MNVGVDVLDLSTNKELFAYHEQKAFVPASTKKLLVVATALDQLGESYRYKIEIYVDGTISPSGVLQGNVILKGYGDPSLSVDDLRQMISQFDHRTALGLSLGEHPVHP